MTIEQLNYLLRKELYAIKNHKDNIDRIKKEYFDSNYGLKEIGITPEVYYASEIDKFAIKQTQLNFPNTIQVGDVRDLNVEDLGHIDLILAGSPCTDMSFSGKRKGLSTVEGIEIKSLNEYLELKKTRI